MQIIFYLREFEGVSCDLTLIVISNFEVYPTISSWYTFPECYLEASKWGEERAPIDWQPHLVVVPDAPSAQRFVPAMRITLAAYILTR